jgi:SsrA-binding protein
MVRPKPAAFEKTKIVAENRRARYEYFIEDVYEAGIMLTGTEVKSLRFGEGSIAESYAEVKNGEVWLINSNVPEFSHGNRHNHTRASCCCTSARSPSFTVRSSARG